MSGFNEDHALTTLDESVVAAPSSAVSSLDHSIREGLESGYEFMREWIIYMGTYIDDLGK